MSELFYCVFIRYSLNIAHRGGGGEGGAISDNVVLIS